MLDEKCLELLNAEIDGELSVAERAELSRRLLESSEARAAREELRSVQVALAQIPMVDPPAQLRERILANLPLPRSSGASSVGRFGSTPLLRYAAAFVGGLLVSAVAFEAMRGQPGISVEETAGTMASPPRLAQGAVTDTLRVDLPQVRGVVHLYPSANQLVVRFDLALQQAAASAPIEVVVSRGDHEARLTGFATSSAGSPGGYAVALPGSLAKGEVVSIRYLAGGVLIREDRWSATAAN